MAKVQSNQETLKQAMKEAIAETLHEERAFLCEVFAEVLEDFALAKAIREGRETRVVERDEVFQSLQARLMRTVHGIAGWRRCVRASRTANSSAAKTSSRSRSS